MKNPIMSIMGQNMPQQPNNPMQMLMNMQNPQQFAQHLLNTNPQARQFMTQMQNMANGRNPKEFALQLAKQNGMDEKQFLEMASRLGAK